MIKTIEQKATDKKAGMTLDELGLFLAEALRQNLPGDTRVRIDIGWGKQLERIEAKG